MSARGKLLTTLAASLAVVLGLAALLARPARDLGMRSIPMEFDEPPAPPTRPTGHH
jgi:hypothetical protein